MYTAISIKVVPKRQGKINVEYERERVIGKDQFYSRIIMY